MVKQGVALYQYEIRLLSRILISRKTNARSLLECERKIFLFTGCRFSIMRSSRDLL